MNTKYKYLPIVQPIVDKVIAMDIPKEDKQWALDRLMIIDDNYRGNPGYSMKAGMQIKAMQQSTDRELKEVIIKTHQEEIGNHNQIQGLA